jgi:V/A-type H+-transporting ATPase subunit G/H
MEELGLVRELAEIEGELAKKLDEARRSAEDRVAKAEEEARRILAETDTQIRQMEETLNARIAQESEKYAKEAQARSEAEAQRIRRQADPNIDQAIDFLLSEVIP